MRKLLVAVLVLATALALASVALAANKYGIDRAQTSPAGVGSASTPIPVSVKFGVSVLEDDPAKRATPIQTYAIAGEGLVTFPKAFPSCSLSSLSKARGVPRTCAKAVIGGGIVKIAAGEPDDPLLVNGVRCNLRLVLYNTGSALALRLDGNPPQPPSLSSNKIGCPVAVHTAVRGTLANVQLEGLPSTELRFGIPEALLHLLGYDASVRFANAGVNLKTARAKVAGRQRTVGFFSSAGCAGGQRTWRVTFGDEERRTFVSTRTTRC